jgi:DNA invertase Pin-like site-specific DNA recombinase
VSTGVPPHLYLQAVDTSTPSGRAPFGMLGIFSEFDREMIVESELGIGRANANGKCLGRLRIGADAPAGSSLNSLNEPRSGPPPMLRRLLKTV